MKIVVVGAGYVGLVVGTGFAENGHRVTCVDKDQALIELLNNGEMPFYEPGLEELVMRNREEERLHFSTDLESAIADCLLIFLCVGTPEALDGAADRTQVFEVAECIGKALNGYRIIVNKSTCPIGTAEAIRAKIAALTTHPFDVVANPEFLKEGAAVDDFMRPDRVVIGCEDVRVLEIMKELYAPFLRTGKPLLSMSIRSAEMAKYAVNAMMATRISLVNELANIAQILGANFSQVREALMADARIGSTYLFPGIGFGGSCLPKDIHALANMAHEHAIPCPVIEGAHQTNEYQVTEFINRIKQYYQGNVTGKNIAVWGLSFKPRTDDIRNAPAIRIIRNLLDAGASVFAYDPVVPETDVLALIPEVTIVPKMYACLEGADGLVVATEWREFHNPDFERMGSLMREKAVFDGRNLYSPKVMERHGFHYRFVGGPDV